MSQVSLPMRIALVGTLAFLALWMVALRPKPPAADPAAATPAPAASPESAPGQAAAQAQQAAGASQEAADKSEQAAGASGDSTSSGSGTATPAQTEAGAQAAPKAGAVDVKIDGQTPKPARDVLNDVLDGKVAVLLFWDRKLSDDKAVHSAVRGLDRRGGKVAVHVASIRSLAQYEPITRGVPVVTSPTVLVIDRAGRARSVGGLTVPRELEELVGKALRVKP